ISHSALHPEKPLSPEKIAETPKKPAEPLANSKDIKVSPVIATNIVTKTNVNSISQQRAAEIDKILADGLEDIFINLPPAEQQKFKLSGEATVAKINKLLEGAKVKVKKIVDLIRRWLATLPGVNRFFLEQEAKIKTDRIMRLKK
ncbi:MAG: hypothetical protein NTX66_01790, partial [Candidatus Falkowbacteria bacterium]|nr:hypothetical protein [Candidatus Falkowbacteria bacterium]